LREKRLVLPTSALDYDLPPGLIATRPVEPRDSARMLVVDRREPGRLQDRIVRELPELLRPGDLLVFNTTRVLPARFHGERVGTGGRMEGLFLHEAPQDGEKTRWVCLLRARHTGEGAVFEVFDRLGAKSGVRLEVIERPDGEPGAWLVGVLGAGTASAEEILDRIGWTPLPPYIVRARREAHQPADEAGDRERYQTVYASEMGSVAAPTAGLHFTTGLLDRLQERGARRADVVLHVGAGTFRPVESEFVEQHPMHAEWCSMGAEAIEAVRRTRAEGGRVIAVGTTAARTLESFAAAADKGDLPPARLHTRLLITPGYQFRWIDGLMTNFHLPRSTLLALVAAFLGEDGVDAVQRAYRHAIDKCYRFYSYGDACLFV
jgi:S-adenosylmethionine:tRNA ribosyltransferase-isomerase